MRVDEQAKQDMRDLAWEELHVRYQLRSLQIRIEISEKVRWNVDNVMPNLLFLKKVKNKNPHEPARFGVNSRKTKKQRVFE